MLLQLEATSRPHRGTKFDFKTTSQAQWRWSQKNIKHDVILLKQRKNKYNIESKDFIDKKLEWLQK